MCILNFYCLLFVTSLLLSVVILDMNRPDPSLDKQSDIGILISMIILILFSLIMIIIDCNNKSKCCKTKPKYNYNTIP